ncbi:unnamed protein product [Moneuplotes crassus]|uniref:Uncharacterized protein n=1 Tax=Euplotes crassus TaxID=5936 RepID=A0AAD1Y7H5_EUPCR|nr:unnamed protein product [Moneuplotes crassus]
MNKIACSCHQIPHKKNCPHGLRQKQLSITPNLKVTNNLESKSLTVMKYSKGRKLFLSSKPAYLIRNRLLRENRTQKKHKSSTNTERIDINEEYHKRFKQSMNLLKLARKPGYSSNIGVRDSTGKNINLITLNRPEEEYLKDSIVRIKDELHSTQHKTYVSENQLKVDDPNALSQLMKSSYGNFSHNLSPDNKSNQNTSQMTNPGRIQIVNKGGQGRSNSQANMRDRVQILSKNITRESNILSAPQKKRSEKKTKEYHVPGKKAKPTKQIFIKSDRISYDFNKFKPFQVSAKKSISEAISEVQAKPERRLIKANNYYLHNFAMEGSGQSSLLSFRLNEILKEKNLLNKKLKEKFSCQPNLKFFTVNKAQNQHSRRHSSNPILVNKKVASKSSTKRADKMDNKKKKYEELESEKLCSSIQHFSQDMQTEEFSSSEDELEKYDNLVYKNVVKSTDRSPLMFKNSLNHISHMNSKMIFAQKEIKIPNFRRHKMK